MVTETLLTADEYLALSDNGQPTELVRGRIVPMNMPAPRHGQICGQIVRILSRSLDKHDAAISSATMPASSRSTIPTRSAARM